MTAAGVAGGVNPAVDEDEIGGVPAGEGTASVIGLAPISCSKLLSWSESLTKCA